MQKIEISSLLGCWLWRGATAGGNQTWDRGGPYGRMRVEGKLIYTHQLSLLLAGKPKPGDGYVPHHWCRRRLCANPLHLEWLTSTENACLSNEVLAPAPF